MILCDFFRMRLFCPFTQDRHRKVTGPCWYDQELCPEQFFRISDPNKTRSELRGRTRPEKNVFYKQLENTFLCIPDHLRPTLFFPLIKLIFSKFFQVQKSGYYSSIWDTDVILCDFFRMRLFCPFTQDRHRKVTGPCWYDQGVCPEQFLASRTQTRPVARPNEGQKIKLVLNDQEYIEKCFPGVLKTPFFGPRWASLRASFRSEMRKNCSEHGS